VTVDLTFGFYGAQSGGSLYLAVLQEDVLVTGGLYSVLIGSGTAISGVEPDLSSVFQKHGDVWMGVKVDADPEMIPRQRITSSPYALAVDLAFLSRARDFDNDGYASEIFGGDDCDDLDPLTYPGAAEIKGDGIDQSCDGYAFGPVDTCRVIDQCGFLEGGSAGVQQCQDDVSTWLTWGLTVVSDFGDCLEGSTNCAQLGSCYLDFVSESTNEFCAAVSNCGYMSESSCLAEISANLEGDEDVLLSGNVCIRDGGSCSAQWVDRCINHAGAQYGEAVQMEWGNHHQFGIWLEARILFSNTSESYSVRNPRGVTYSLSPDDEQGWRWVANTWYDSLDELASAWPPGEYTILQGNTIKDIFTMPPYEAADFPNQAIGIYPAHGSSVSDNPLTIYWQLSGPHSEPAGIELHMHNYTRGGYEDIGDDLLPADALSGDVPIPAGTQTGDTLFADVVTLTPETFVYTPVDRMFWRQFEFRKSPTYTWTGPPQ